MKQKGILVVVSGFSGAGKGTLMKRLLACRKYLYTVKRLYVENAFLAASRCLAPDIHSTYFFFASVEKCITG